MNNIAFKGEISDTSKKFLQKQQIKNALIACIICFVIIGAVIILLGVFCSLLWLLFFIIPVAMCAMVIASPLVSPEVPLSVIIDGDNISVVDQSSTKKLSTQINVVRKIKQVKKVIDTGFCYYIVFKFPHKLLCCLCQKDLLAHGTLEEFEKIFDGKIVTKHIKK